MREKQEGTKAGLALDIYNSGKLFLHKVLKKLAYFKLCQKGELHPIRNLEPGPGEML